MKTTNLKHMNHESNCRCMDLSGNCPNHHIWKCQECQDKLPNDSHMKNKSMNKDHNKETCNIKGCGYCNLIEIPKRLEDSTYKLNVYCTNCSYSYQEMLPKGVQVIDCKCAHCGCKTLSIK